MDFFPEIFLIPVKAMYIMCTGFMGLFGIQQLILLYWYWRSKEISQSLNFDHSSASLPFITVQLPLYNEPLVVERLLEAVLQLQYPVEKLEVQILDDSTDQTTEIIQKKIKSVHSAFSIFHLTRTNRKGFKAGALQNGLHTAKGEFLAIFDADFLPEPEFLKKVIPFFNKQDTAVVQSRWAHLNSNANLLTRLQAFGLDAHFTIEQNGRQSADGFLNFNGTGGIWRKAAILQAGGWSDDTLTEDLDLSYRVQLKGWRVIYLDSLCCPGELPENLPALRSQQYRWNKGGAQTAVKLLGAVLRSNVSYSKKWHAFFHLNSSAVFPAIWFACLSGVALLLGIKDPSNGQFKFGLWMFSGFLTVLIFYGVSAKVNRYSILPNVFFFLLFSLGLSWINTKAVVSGWLGKKSEFIRTPKSGLNPKKSQVFGLRFGQLLPEAFFGLLFISFSVVGLIKQVYWLIPLHTLTGLGLLMLVFYGLKGSSNQMS